MNLSQRHSRTYKFVLNTMKPLSIPCLLAVSTALPLLEKDHIVMKNMQFGVRPRALGECRFCHSPDEELELNYCLYTLVSLFVK
jgi:hypothetical protein